MTGWRSVRKRYFDEDRYRRGHHQESEEKGRKKQMAEDQAWRKKPGKCTFGLVASFGI
jgi:hypothetical protein